MDFLLSAVTQFLEFVALVMYVFFWCVAGGVGSWLLWLLVRFIRHRIQRQAELDSIDRWHSRNQKIAGAAVDLDHHDRLQRELAESYINTLLPSETLTNTACVLRKPLKRAQDGEVR